MTDVQDDRLMRDGFREQALNELLADPHAPTREIEVRWLGPEQVAEVRIDVKALDRLIEMADRPALNHDECEAMYDDGKDYGHQVAVREIVKILNAKGDNLVIIAAIEKWADL